MQDMFPLHQGPHTSPESRRSQAASSWNTTDELESKKVVSAQMNWNRRGIRTDELESKKVVSEVVVGNIFDVAVAKTDEVAEWCDKAWRVQEN